MDIAGIKSTNLKFLFFFQLNKFTLCHFLFLNGSKTKNLKPKVCFPKKEFL